MPDREDFESVFPLIPGLEGKPPGQGSHGEGTEDVHRQRAPGKHDAAITGAAEIDPVPERAADPGAEEDEEVGGHRSDVSPI